MRKSPETSRMNSKENECLFAAAVVGFFFLLIISELANLKPSDVVFENTPRGRRLIIFIRKSKTDQAGKGVTRALLETDENISPVKVLGNLCEIGLLGRKKIYSAKCLG